MEAQQIARQAGTARQQAGECPRRVVLPDPGRTLIFEDFGQMMHAGIEHGDGLSLAAEGIDDGGHQHAGVAHQGLARLQPAFQILTFPEAMNYLGQGVGLIRRAGMIAAANVDPAQALPMRAQGGFDGRQRVPQGGGLADTVMGVEMQTRQAARQSGLFRQCAAEVLQGYTQLGMRSAGVIANIPDHREPGVDPDAHGQLCR